MRIHGATWFSIRIKSDWVLRKSLSLLEFRTVLSERTEENHKTLPGQPVSGFESGTVQIPAANHTAATVGYYIIRIIIIVVITELFLYGLGVMNVNTLRTTGLSANADTH